MAAYIIVDVEVTDQARYDDYRQLIGPSAGAPHPNTPGRVGSAKGPPTLT